MSFKSYKTSKMFNFNDYADISGCVYFYFYRVIIISVSVNNLLGLEIICFRISYKAYAYINKFYV